MGACVRVRVCKQVAEKYLDGFSKLARESTTVLLPANPGGDFFSQFFLTTLPAIALQIRKDLCGRLISSYDSLNMVVESRIRKPRLFLNPEPKTIPNPYTLNPKPETLNPKP